MQKQTNCACLVGTLGTPEESVAVGTGCGDTLAGECTAGAVAVGMQAQNETALGGMDDLMEAGVGDQMAGGRLVVAWLRRLLISCPWLEPESWR